jgi:hypothetical protein
MGGPLCIDRLCELDLPTLCSTAVRKPIEPPALDLFEGRFDTLKFLYYFDRAMKSALGFLVICALVGVLGCGLFSTISEREKDRKDIEAALNKYLNEQRGLNLSAMTWDVKEFSQDRDRATVQVMFIAKENKEAQMPVTYELLRVNGVWTVQKPSSGAGHPGLNPPQKAAPQGGELPTGHPPLGGSEPMKSQPKKQ